MKLNPEIQAAVLAMKDYVGTEVGAAVEAVKDYVDDRTGSIQPMREFTDRRIMRAIAERAELLSTTSAWLKRCAEDVPK